MRTSKYLWLGLSLAAFACSGSDGSSNFGDDDDGQGGTGTGSGGNLPHTLESILITPLNTVIELDVNTPGTQAFTASALYADGESEDITDQATWTVSNTAVGSFTGATLDIPGFAMGVAESSLVRAEFEGTSGTGQITVVAYRKTGPQQDFFFILPFEDPDGNKSKPLDFSTAIPSLDVFFMMDTTGSMGSEIGNLQSSLNSTIVPGVQAAVANTYFGVGRYDDFPLDVYGTPGCDQPFELLQGMTSNIGDVTTAVNNLTLHCGNDGPESMLEGFYQAATGEGIMAPAPTFVAPNMTGVGGVGFRDGVMPVIAAAGDWMSHSPGEPGSCLIGGSIPQPADYPLVPNAHTRQETKDALDAICARVVGVASGVGDWGPACEAQADLEDLATHTGARVPPEAWDVPARPAGCAVGQCCTNFNGTGRAPDADGLCPLVFYANNTGSGLGAHMVTGIQMLTRFATFDATTEKEGETESIDGVPLPSGTTTADFIKAITPNSFMLPPPPPVVPNPTFDSTSFQNVTPGTVVTFDVVAFNDFVQAGDQALIYHALVRVLAGGCSPLDERQVIILVPPNSVAPPM
jgi:hypothetical protein